MKFSVLKFALNFFVEFVAFSVIFVQFEMEMIEFVAVDFSFYPDGAKTLRNEIQDSKCVFRVQDLEVMVL